MRRHAFLLALLLPPLGAQAQNIQNWVCVSGTCVMENPVFVNVYWDTSEAKWDSDAAGFDKTATVARIDALTRAICHSAYFSGLKQYDVRSCQVHPSIVENHSRSVPPS